MFNAGYSSSFVSDCDHDGQATVKGGKNFTVFWSLAGLGRRKPWRISSRSRSKSRTPTSYKLAAVAGSPTNILSCPRRGLRSLPTLVTECCSKFRERGMSKPRLTDRSSSRTPDISSSAPSCAEATSPQIGARASRNLHCFRLGST